MSYLSKATLLSAYSQLSGLTDDPTSQGATQFVSAIRYCFALDEFVKKYGHSCDTQNKTDRLNYIECVGHVVSLYDNVFTVNFYSSLNENLKSAIGSNLFSVNSVKNSLENKSKEFEYPKRSGWLPILVIKNGLLEQRDEWMQNITYYLNSVPNRCAFAVWLCRNVNLTSSDIYGSIEDFLKERYSSELINILLPQQSDFKEFVDIEIQNNPVEFIREDFPRAAKKNTDIEKKGLLPSDELAERVKDSFIKFWKLIDQHRVDCDRYIANYENALNPYLQTLDEEYNSVFQIVDYQLYSSIIKRLSDEFPEIAYILNGRQNNGVRYEVGSTHVHYSNYLSILANSDFRQNIDKEQEEFKRLRQMAHIDQPLQLIYYGAPGTGKSFTIDKATDESNSVRTTFHPDSDYAGFVGAYKPTMEYVHMSAFVGKEVHVAQPQGEHSGKEKKIVYKYVPQAFLKAYVEAWKRYSEAEDNPYYLVIEEINRGNCAQIFGDLFQLLDRNNIGSSSYAISADEDITQFLRDDKNGFAGFSQEQRDVISRFVLKKDSGAKEQIGQSILDGSKLLLPPNMRIWATMNTSDQSLFPIDSAFKRRWNWEYVPIEYEQKDWTFVVDGKRYLWGDFLKMINPKIFKLTMSEDKQMGYFFAKPDQKSSDSLEENDTISEKIFVNKVLFYLWTDVFKDYDLTEEPFVYKDKDKRKVAYRFTDFFPINENRMLAQFVDGLKLPLVDSEQDNLQVEFDAEGDTELNNGTDSKSRDYSKYSVNGNGSYTKSDAVVEAVKAIVETMPEATAEYVLEKIKSLNLSYTLAYSEADYQYYLEQSNDPRFTKRYAKIDLPDGQSVYIYRGSTPERIGELIAGLKNSGSGVVLAKVE